MRCVGKRSTAFTGAAPRTVQVACHAASLARAGVSKGSGVSAAVVAPSTRNCKPCVYSSMVSDGAAQAKQAIRRCDQQRGRSCTFLIVSRALSRFDLRFAFCKHSKCSEEEVDVGWLGKKSSDASFGLPDRSKDARSAAHQPVSGQQPCTAVRGCLKVHQRVARLVMHSDPAHDRVVERSHVDRRRSAPAMSRSSPEVRHEAQHSNASHSLANDTSPHAPLLFGPAAGLASATVSKGWLKGGFSTAICH